MLKPELAPAPSTLSEPLLWPVYQFAWNVPIQYFLEQVFRAQVSASQVLR